MRQAGTTEQAVFPQHRGRLLVAISVIFVLAAGIRLHHLDSSRVNAEHQYQSALIARQHFLEASDSVPAWRKEVVASALSRQRVLEAPIFPLVTSLGYRVLGRETLALPRLMAMLSWLLAGAFLILLTRRLASADAAWLAAIYFLLVPSGVELSVSFLPDSLMVMLMVMSLFAIVLFFDQRSPVRFVVAWVVSAAAIVIKPVCMFPIAGGLIGLALQGARSSDWPRRLASAAALLVLSMSSGSVYYLLGILRGGEVAQQVDVSFVPRLLLHRAYWEGWLESASWAVGFTPLAVAVLGQAAMRPGPQRALTTGLWGGYIAYCLLFSYHIHFAGHYHLMLVPIVALSFAPMVPRFLRLIREVSGSWLGRGLCTILILLALATTLRSIRNTFDAAARFESPDAAAEIGEIVEHSTETVFLSPYYGAPLQYYGELAGEWWPRAHRHWALRDAAERERSVRDRFRGLGFKPEYFIVTDFPSLWRHEVDLEAFLSQRCKLLAENPEYLIYELRGCL